MSSNDPIQDMDLPDEAVLLIMLLFLVGAGIVLYFDIGLLSIF
jgi:hypothetical protein